MCQERAAGRSDLRPHHQRQVRRRMRRHVMVLTISRTTAPNPWVTRVIVWPVFATTLTAGNRVMATRHQVTHNPPLTTPDLQCPSPRRTADLVEELDVSQAGVPNLGPSGGPPAQRQSW